MKGKTIAALTVFVWFCVLVAPLFVPIIMGASIAILMFPIFKFLVDKKVPKALASVLVTTLMTLVFIVPTIFLSLTGARVGIDLFRRWKESAMNEAFNSGDQSFIMALSQVRWIADLLEKVGKIVGADPDELLKSFSSGIKVVVIRLGDGIGGTIGTLPGLFISTFLLVLTVFYFLMDGERFVAFLKTFPIFTRKQTNRLLITFSELSRSVLLASILSGIGQSTLYMLAMLIAGVPNVPFFGLVVFLGSFIPVIGAGPFTIGLGIYLLFMEESHTPGIILLVTSALTGILDNIIRPVVLKGTANLHPLLALIGLFGGLQLYGFAGIFVGPVIAGMCVSILKAWNESES
jgi:predicted PurR-regulated permease PerM